MARYALKWFGALIFSFFAVFSVVLLEAIENLKPTLSMEIALSLKLPTVNNLVWLKDSAQLIASLEESESKTASLEVWDITSGERHTLTQGKYPSVSPDQKWFVYLDGAQWKLRSLQDDKTMLIGEEAPFEPTVFSPPQWSRDSRCFSIVDTLRSPSTPFNVEPEVQDGVRVLDVGHVADGPAQAEKDIPRITIFDISKLEKSQSVLIEEDYVYYGNWGPNKTYYFVSMQGYWGGKQAYTALKRLDTDTLVVSEIYRLENGFMQSAEPVVSPDGRYIALALDVDLGKWDDYVSLVLIDSKSGELKKLTTSQYVQAYVWAADGKSLYFTGRCGGLNQIYQVSIEGNVRQVTHGELAHSEIGLSFDGSWLSYQTSNGYAHKDIRVRSTHDDLERIIAVTADPGNDLRFGEFKQVKWRTHDGLDIFGYLFLPPDFDPNKKYPLYVDVHGGGPGSPLLLMGTLTSTPLEWHVWSALGYVVFVPDMRSSGEYGPRIAEKRYSTHTWDWTGIQEDVSDIESGTCWLIAQGYIDPKRVAVFGHSAGGGRVNLLLTRSHLYSAGIIHDQIPAGALPSMITNLSGKSTGTGFDENHLTNGVKLMDNPSVYTNGFLFDGYKNHTPTLIMVGNPDKGAISPLSSEVLFSILRQYKVPTRMLRYIDDGHNPLTAASALHRYREIKNWLETYIPPASP